jgi:hypothetical protein
LTLQEIVTKLTNTRSCGIATLIQHAAMIVRLMPLGLPTGGAESRISPLNGQIIKTAEVHGLIIWIIWYWETSLGNVRSSGVAPVAYLKSWFFTIWFIDWGRNRGATSSVHDLRPIPGRVKHVRPWNENSPKFYISML